MANASVLAVSAAEGELASVAKAGWVVVDEVAEVEGKHRLVHEAGVHETVERSLHAARLPKKKDEERDV